MRAATVMHIRSSGAPGRCPSQTSRVARGADRTHMPPCRSPARFRICRRSEGDEAPSVQEGPMAGNGLVTAGCAVGEERRSRTPSHDQPSGLATHRCIGGCTRPQVAARRKPRPVPITPTRRVLQHVWNVADTRPTVLTHSATENPIPGPCSDNLPEQTNQMH